MPGVRGHADVGGRPAEPVRAGDGPVAALEEVIEISTVSLSRRKNAGPSTGAGLTGPYGGSKMAPGLAKAVSMMCLWLVVSWLSPARP